MSQYLLDVIEGSANIEVRPNTEVIGGGGGSRLEQVLVHDRLSGETSAIRADEDEQAAGAAPRTRWLPDDVRRDRWGYLVAGPDLEAPEGMTAATENSRPPLMYETSRPGLFAVGDVRNGSVKRVASAVGEGSAVISQVHAHLSALRRAHDAGARRDIAHAPA
jgi:thioredoxin reductase (NADPH)